MHGGPHGVAGQRGVERGGCGGGPAYLANHDDIGVAAHGAGYGVGVGRGPVSPGRGHLNLPDAGHGVFRRILDGEVALVGAGDDHGLHDVAQGCGFAVSRGAGEKGEAA